LPDGGGTGGNGQRCGANFAANKVLTKNCFIKTERRLASLWATALQFFRPSKKSFYGITYWTAIG
jgi:hypothetical protein